MSGPTRARRDTRAVSVLGLLALSVGVACAQPTPEDLGNLSLEDLGKVVVTSVSKSAEPLGDAPAAIYVISHDEIMRSGATSLPEILRLAPNLEVFQTSPSSYTITARGFNGSNVGQNFSDKLLVLIDGRSVYSPIFSGMYWEDQYVLPANIERIEVISGPGGALWGANAVNGVINIITRKAADTQGGLLNAQVGNLESGVAVQYGGALGQDVHYRVYARDFRRQSFENSAKQDAHDGWTNPQVGFRVDWDADASDAVMLQGDAHRAHIDGPVADQRSTEADLAGRWVHAISDVSSFQLQAYYDRVLRYDAYGDGFSLSTWDIEAQHSFTVGERHQIVWGAGDRVYHYSIASVLPAAYLWDPAVNTQNLANAFVQDQIALSQKTNLTLGLKAENDPYSGVSLMPNIRLSWKPNPDVLLWAAASRAVRTPTPFDEDVIGRQGSFTFLLGNPNFKREKLTAYEVGWRAQAATRATVSVSLYYNVYDDLKTLEFPPPTLFPAFWGNEMEGFTYGLEAWGSYAIADWWHISAGLMEEREHLRLKPDSHSLLGTWQSGHDPDHQAFIRSSMNLSDRWTLDADLREVGSLQYPHVPAYTELNARLGWQVNDKLQISLSGFNLLHPWHQEYAFPFSDRIGRSVFLDTRVKF